ncbi:hypothetical protein D187_008296 [Cystobacter fuscus DSM 2262]|uniref:Uncharacterized protein n=1 Tax=Cystobacter fuscus (strain ATCC 25194 / DSM 2262 / NBRC 100088 / M29) TaxID=1242864 RepID=S9NU84_CYSF2|nr:hypothetical protein D187_008296 [Cystobacter fuscus DSM 2262]
MVPRPPSGPANCSPGTSASPSSAKDIPPHDWQTLMRWLLEREDTCAS